ncbi:hypothetical protein NFI96_016106 [Prochilodus magdalenae]|nr:hypothetical protein NFI96_016106 [Prochilodus magdalenae]
MSPAPLTPGVLLALSNTSRTTSKALKSFTDTTPSELLSLLLRLLNELQDQLFFGHGASSLSLQLPAAADGVLCRRPFSCSCFILSPLLQDQPFTSPCLSGPLARIRECSQDLDQTDKSFACTYEHQFSNSQKLVEVKLQHKALCTGLESEHWWVLSNRCYSVFGNELPPQYSGCAYAVAYIKRFGTSIREAKAYLHTESAITSVQNITLDELSTTAGLDSSMDEEDASLDAPCMQNTTDSEISLSPITDAGASQPAGSPSALKSSSSHSSLEPESETAHAPTEHTQPAAQQDAGTHATAQCILKSVFKTVASSLDAWLPMLSHFQMHYEGSIAMIPRYYSHFASLSRESLVLNNHSPAVWRNLLKEEHQDEGVSSDREPVKGSVPTEEGKKCSKGDEVACTHEIEQAKNGGMKRGGSVKTEEIAQDPLQWSVADVVNYFTAEGFPEQAVAFRTQEINGKSLLLMQLSDVLTVARYEWTQRDISGQGSLNQESSYNLAQYSSESV